VAIATVLVFMRLSFASRPAVRAPLVRPYRRGSGAQSPEGAEGALGAESTLGADGALCALCALCGLGALCRLGALGALCGLGALCADGDVSAVSDVIELPAVRVVGETDGLAEGVLPPVVRTCSTWASSEDPANDPAAAAVAPSPRTPRAPPMMTTLRVLMIISFSSGLSRCVMSSKVLGPDERARSAR